MPSPSDTLLAYQPIYSDTLSLIGGELLYRSDSGLSALDIGDNLATSELIFNLCTGITEQFEGFNHPLFINVSTDFILSDAFLPLEPSRVVIELVERIEPNDAFVAAVKRWHQQGFRFALDDFEYSPRWEPLLRYCDIIKIDIQSHNAARTRQLMHQLRDHNLTWLAERVETPGQYDTYKAMGFTRFQGYFLARPQIISGQKIPPEAANLARLIDVLFDDEVDVKQLSDLIANDPIISIKLLKIANSPFYRGQDEITSLHQALMRLGLTQLRKWVILIGSLGGQGNAAVQLVLTRANTCSELARLHLDDSVDANKAFLAALLSGVDILLKVDKQAFIETLHLPQDIQCAALEQRGPTGAVVNMVLQAERTLLDAEQQHKVSSKVIQIYQTQSVRTQQLLESL